MGLLDGKKIVITGVLTDASLAFGVAQLAQREGAQIVLTGAGRALSLPNALPGVSIPPLMSTSSMSQSLSMSRPFVNKCALP
ncbi:MAG: enoyl-[acyl-carrier-protein] reductase [Actinomycetota bacterium]